MISEIEVVDMPATVLASVRRRIAWRDIGTAIPAQLDPVYAMLRGGGVTVKQTGHNVCVYHRPDAEGVELEAGVQVSGTFADGGGDGDLVVRCSATPSGRAAWVIYHGGYDKLGEAHDPLVAFCKAQGGDGAGGPAWEVYGDWSNDPVTTRTDVYRLLGR